jgi:hypothetical protein
MNQIKELLNKAVNAPSGDNSQPWWFHIEGESLEIHLYPGKDNRILNFQLSGSYIAMGALIENISIMATTIRMEATIELFPDHTRPNLVAIMRFTKTSIHKDMLADIISERCTNRKQYKKRAISDEVLNEILQAGNTIKVNTVKLTTSESKMKQLANASSIMERVALETKAIHKLFFESIVWNKEEEQKKGMGLPIKTTELPPPIRLLFRVIRYWPVTRVLNCIGLSFLASKANAQTYATGGAAGIILADTFDKYAYVNAGRIFERVWLTATKHGLAFQPITGVLFLAQRVQEKETEVFHSYHIPLITSSYQTIMETFAVKNEIPAMLFRIGYADKPSARTTRKPPEFR